MHLRPLSFGPSGTSNVAGGLDRPRRRRRMMRTLIAAVMLLAAALVCPRLCADDEKDKGAGEIVVERIQDLNLTDEQEAKIAEIMKENQPKVQEAAKELVGIVKEEV